MNGSLSALVDLLMKKIDDTKPNHKMEDLFPNTVQCIKESRFSEEVLPLLKGKLAYPYNLAQTIDDFERIDSLIWKKDHTVKNQN